MDDEDCHERENDPIPKFVETAEYVQGPDDSVAVRVKEETVLLQDL